MRNLDSFYSLVVVCCINILLCLVVFVKNYSATDLAPRHFHFLRESAFAHGGFLHFLIFRERAQ